MAFGKLFPPASGDDFAALMMAAAKAAGHSDSLVYDSDRFCLKPPGDGVAVMYLVNAYDEYRAALPWNRRGVIERFARLYASLDSVGTISPDDARANLRARVRERIIFEHLKLENRVGGAQAMDTPYRVLGDHLTVEVVYDLPQAIRSVSRDQLAEWGMTFEEALSLGAQNLLSDGPSRFKTLRSGLYLSEWRDNYDASRLPLPEIVPSLAVKGRHVAMVPSRDVLIVTGSEDPEGLVAMAKYAQDVLQKPRPMSGFAFQLGARWEAYLPPPEHPAHALLKLLSAQALAQYYQQQANSLNALHAKDNTDIFVAEYMAYRDKKTGVVTASASWARDVDSLLPRADQILLSERDPAGGIVLLGAAPWERVAAVAGDLFEAQDLYPPRFRVRGFPTPAQLAEIAPQPLT
ncbi:hypothetical protein CCAX7_64810 [Capsulimonas corticalis]|uniref:Uncharacterized protein n=1 Tax=Capsulimonas corticalis TaxID=2219043 RepID=A0A402CQQ4_9BACT|nr:hypothetical protein [Capsulimonas corticalis]BDI34430.1 hypothetical protein CCAX7_64810 [Capsulimonas corticalis]